MNRPSIRTRVCSEDAAKRAGFTRRVHIDGEGSSFEGLIEPDADLDGAFEVYDCDSEEWGVVSGWIADSIEDVEP